MSAQSTTALRFTEETGEAKHTVRRADSGFPIAVLTGYRRIERAAFARQFAGSSELLDAAHEALEICRTHGGPQLPRLFDAVMAIMEAQPATQRGMGLVITGSDAELCTCVGNDECGGACRVYGPGSAA